MNKAELKTFAIETRRDLLEKVALRAKLFGIDESKSTLTMNEQFGQLTVNEKPYPSHMKRAFTSLERELNTKGYKQLIEEVAYTWFNRIIAIRYMEVNGYLPERVHVLSSSTGKAEPDILNQYDSMDLHVKRDEVADDIRKGDTEAAYRKLFISQCNALNSNLPFLFEKINDYTELLLPDFLLDTESVISKLVRNAELTESFNEVEVIGWLYQFYNTEPKDQVFANLKKNKKIEKYDIPAATQLFTPKWIVQYMVENSLGQIWLESNPDSPIKESMRYYIEPAEQEEEVQKQLEEIRYKNVNLEEITIIDPCVGSGHILVYAFDLLYEMYEEAGYPSNDIPQLILEKNLYGLDIDDRAAQLASFALMMKAREKSRRIFRKNVELNIIHIQDSSNINTEQIIESFFRDDVEAERLKSVIETFENSKNLGALILPPEINYSKMLERISEIDNQDITLENYMLLEELNIIKKLLKQAKVLTNNYDVVITNPPYMGSRKAMNTIVKKFVEKNYNESKSDLYACFIERAMLLSRKNGLIGLVTQQSFMFTDDYKRLRKKLLENINLINMCHLGAGAFPEINGEVVQTTSFILKNNYLEKFKGKFIRLVDFFGEDKKLNIHNKSYHFSKFSNSDFKDIKGYPFSYWMSSNMKRTFIEGEEFENIGRPRAGITTGNNDKFVRVWTEVSYDEIGFNHLSTEDFHISNSKYVPYNKGGKQRKWYGNNDFLLKFDIQNYRLLENQGNHLPSRQHYFQKCITWSDISGRSFAARYCDNGFVFDVKGSCGFPEENSLFYVLALLNSNITPKYIDTLNPTLTTQVGDLKRIPVIKQDIETVNIISKIASQNVDISKKDWDSFETSYDFSSHPLLTYKEGAKNIEKSFLLWERQSQHLFLNLKTNEEKLNKLFIELYNLQYELSPNVLDEDIMIRKADRVRDTKSFLSYFIGCMMGRYSLDVEGIACAGGEWDESKYQTFKPNNHGLVLLTDDRYFDDDIITRLREFLSVTFSPETVDENMEWIAESLTMKKNESSEERLRRYFIDEFFKDHVKTYQKRPIYWLVDSGKQKGLRTLVYLHRYQPDTMATIRFEHLQEIQAKYNNGISSIDSRIVNPSLSATEKRELDKKKTLFQKRLDELVEFDKDLAMYANEQIDIDLDDGVNVNYAKFDKVLAKI